MPKNKLRSFAIAAALASCFTTPVFASSFYLVVPVPSASKGVADAGASDISSVTLLSFYLPTARVAESYSVFLSSLLEVQGDPNPDFSKATWSLVDGTLPAGLTFNAKTGEISGTPLYYTPYQNLQDTVTFQANYKGHESNMASYNLQVVVNTSVSLAYATLPSATLNNPYNKSLRDYLTITGDPALNLDEVYWSFDSGSLPAGLTFDKSTGLISGTPTSTTSSPMNFMIFAWYKGNYAWGRFTIEVAPAGAILER